MKKKICNKYVKKICKRRRYNIKAKKKQQKKCLRSKRIEAKEKIKRKTSKDQDEKDPKETMKEKKEKKYKKKIQMKSQKSPHSINYKSPGKIFHKTAQGCINLHEVPSNSEL